MNIKTKKKFKKLGSSLVGGFRKTKEFVDVYGPKAHSYLSKTSNAAMNAVAVTPRRSYVELPLRPVKVGKKKYHGKFTKTKRGSYLDFT
ncbi:MAG: hypothetical protein PHS54_01245 [Clostridia bacterium]|nr:hypothetical protein [Clostridia bacterium]